MSRIASISVVAALLFSAGCAGNGESISSTPSVAAQAATAVASVALVSRSDSDVTGELSFARSSHGVHVTGQLRGLEPGSIHGFHIHEDGNCSAPDASSADGHFNPGHEPHGHPATPPHHAGDIPNQHADANGVANVDEIVEGIEIGTGSEIDVLGRAVIVHAAADDYESQPSGDAGARVACGVITSS